MTEAQKRALIWLVPGKVMEADRSVSAAAQSLVLYHKRFAISRWYETPRGRNYLGYTLTDAGVAERDRLMKAALSRPTP